MVNGSHPAESVALLKKGELHVHLNGLVSPSLIRSILAEEAIPLPRDFDPNRDLTRTEPCASLGDYLKPWQVLRRIPLFPANLQQMTHDAFNTLKENNVSFVEFRTSVIYLANLQNCSVASALSRILEATERSSERTGIRCGIVMTVTRGDYSAVQLETLLKAYRELEKPRNVVGLDLAGDEANQIPADLGSLFRQAKDTYGLGLTIHAGEIGIINNVIAAIHDFDADRIGHGTAAGASPEVMDELRRRDICLEVCPISSRLTVSTPSSPLLR